MAVGFIDGFIKIHFDFLNIAAFFRFLNGTFVVCGGSVFFGVDFAEELFFVLGREEIVECAVDFMDFVANDFDAPLVLVEEGWLDFEDMGEIFRDGVDSAVHIHDEEPFFEEG